MADEIVLRVRELAKTHSLSEIARRTQTPLTNVHRYVNGGRVPAEFCTALIRGMAINPAWLMAGEGTPNLSDVTASTSAMAGDILELVEAMNSVTKMRLGSLAGKHHLRVLRDLNDALVQYERLRARLNAHSRGIFAQMLGDLGKAVSAMDVARATELRKAALQVSRLCDDANLARDFASLQAHVEYLLKNDEKGLLFQREVFLRSLLPGAGFDESICEQFVRFSLMLLELQRAREAHSVCRIGLILAGKKGRSLRGYAALGFLRGHLLLLMGRLDLGMRLMQRWLPHTSGRRALAGSAFWTRALLYARMTSLPDAIAVEPHIPPKLSAVLTFAMWSEDAAALESALAYADSGRVTMSQIDEDHTPLARLVLRALRGDRGVLAAFDPGQKSGVSEAHHWINATLLARLCGESKAARAALDRAQAALRKLPRELHVDLMTRATHHRNVLRLIDPKTKNARDRARRKQARKFFARHLRRGYACFQNEA